MRIPTLLLGFLFLCGSAAVGADGRDHPRRATRCMQLQVPGVALTVTKTEWFAAGAPVPGGRGGGPPAATNLPAYCRLDGVIDRRTGAAGVDLRHRIRARAAGELERPIPVPGRRGLERLGPDRRSAASAAGERSGLARGFAVVSTDTGHQGRGAIRRQLHAGPAGEPRLRVRRDRPRGGRRQAHHRAALRQAAGSFVLRGMLHRRARGDADGAALPAVLRWRRRGRAGDAHQLLRHRRSLGGRDAERDRAEERAGPAGHARRALGQRQEGGHRRHRQRLRRRRRRSRTA